MLKKGKGAIKMTDVLTNFENVIDNCANETKDEINPRVELIFMVYRFKKLIKTDFAQKIIKENIVKDKNINQGRYTIKGTRITPEDIGQIMINNKNVSINTIYDELPSIENEEQILAGLFVFIKKNFTWRKILFSK